MFKLYKGSAFIYYGDKNHPEGIASRISLDIVVHMEP